MQDHIFKTASDTQTPQGVLCIVRQQESDLKTLLEAEKPLLLLLENLQDPGNLGTILRTGGGRRCHRRHFKQRLRGSV